MPPQASTFLRRVLLLDAAMTGATALLLVLAAGVLAAPLGLPEALMRWAGAALIPFAGFVAWLATRDRPARGLVWAVVAANALWVVDSVLILVLGWVAPTTLGVVFVVGQAAVVAAFTELQFIGLKRTVSYA
jgi:hypothetical protein